MSVRSLLLVSALLLVTISTELFAEVPFVPRQRPAELVSQTDAAVVLKNVRWGFVENRIDDPVFKDTTIRFDHVREVYYYSQRFDPKWLAAHGTLVFLMKDLDGVVSQDGSRDIGLVFSVEVHYRVGQTYEIKKALKKYYPVHYQLTTVGDRLQWAFPMSRETIERFRLKLDQGQKVQLLKNAVAEALVDHSREWYHLITNSCVGNAVRVTNSVLPENRQVPVWRIPGVWFNMQLALPNVAPKYLARKGLVSREDPTWTPGLPYVEFPLADGTTYRVNLGDHPGQPLTEDRTRLALGLEELVRHREALACLDRLQTLLSPASKEFWEYQEEMTTVLNSLEEIHQGLIAEFSRDLEGSLRYYLALELSGERSLDLLEKDVLRLVNARAQAGQFPDTALLARARKALARSR